MKTSVEIEVTLKGRYRPEQKETQTDPSWPSFIDDFSVWFGDIDITEKLPSGEVEMLENAYLEWCEEK